MGDYILVLEERIRINNFLASFKTKSAYGECANCETSKKIEPVSANIGPKILSLKPSHATAL
jgi:hypothetical protein